MTAAEQANGLAVRVGFNSGGVYHPNAIAHHQMPATQFVDSQLGPGNALFVKIGAPAINLSRHVSIIASAPGGKVFIGSGQHISTSTTWEVPYNNAVCSLFCFSVSQQ